MPKKDKVVDLFQDMIKKVKDNEGEEEKQPALVNGNGHVFVSGGQPTVNVYNLNAKEK